MKKIIFLSLAVILAAIILQGCCGCGETEIPKGVMKFDSEKSDSVVGYDWSFVDVTTGFATIPAGFMGNKDGAYQPQLTSKQIKLVEEMLFSLQKEFEIKITNYQLIYPYSCDVPQLYLRLFFEPAVNPEIKVLQTAVGSLQSQNSDLQSNVNALKSSLWQTKNQLNQIKKMIEDKK